MLTAKLRSGELQEIVWIQDADSNFPERIPRSFLLGCQPLVLHQ